MGFFIFLKNDHPLNDKIHKTFLKTLPSVETMLTPESKAELEKQQYRIVGKHSAVKVCLWTKRSLRDEDVCYKEQFYDTICHRCVQMTPALDTCTHRCIWCWRDIDHTKPKWQGVVDDPKLIVEECIKQNKKYCRSMIPCSVF